MSKLIERHVEVFRTGTEVAAIEAEALLDAMLSETDEDQLANLLCEWSKKGITEGEIYAFANVLRGRMVRVETGGRAVADIVGTGGSKAKTFNVSTAAAFVAAAAGIRVAKHGNRAATSRSGSSDVLSELGIDPATDPGLAERCLEEIGLCFLFAPNHHRLSPTLAKVRRGLGTPTIFNCVGPLCNPASASFQVIGVWCAEMVPKMAAAAARLGTQRTWVVNGHDRLDELMLEGTTNVAIVEYGLVKFGGVSAADLDLGQLAGDLPAHCAAEQSAATIRAVLANKMKDRDAEKLVLLNAGALIHVAGQAGELREGYEAAREAIRNGRADEKLRRLAEMTKV